MKIFIQVVKGSVYELEVNEHTSIEEAQDLLINNYEDDFKNNLPSQSNNSIVITYNFVYNGKYLFDPDPFSTLKENSRVILYIKKSRARGMVNLEIVGDSENEAEEEDSGPIGINQDIRQYVIRAANASLISQVFNPRNNFWNHSSELSQIENILQGEDSQAAHYISSTFMEERFHQLFRYNDINIGTVLNVMGGGPLLTFGNGQNNANQNNNENNNNNDNDNDNDNNNDNDNSNNPNSININNSNTNLDRSLYNNRIYNNYNNSPNIVSELDILIMEMPTTAKNAYNTLLQKIDAISELKQISRRVGSLKIAQIFKENGYDIEKSIDSIRNINQDSQQNDSANTSNNDNN